MKRILWTVIIAVAGLVSTVGVAVAILPDETDLFADGTTEGWQQGVTSGTNPSNIPTGGPAGTGDNYLQVVSTGSGGPGGKMVVLNRAQWTGDYNALGPEFTISMDLANFGAQALSIRVGLEGVVAIPTPEGTLPRFVSTTPFALPADGVWRQATFVLSATEMTQVDGSGTLSDVLDDVAELRILSASSASWRGDQVAATLGVDNIQVVALPVELTTFTVD